MFPIHPVALDGESLESYLGRLSFDNRYSIWQFLSSYSKVKVVRDFDGLDPQSDTIERLSKLLGVTSASLKQMTISSFECLGDGLDEIRTWTSTSYSGEEGRSYCPLCLREARTPYFKLAWRLRFVSICPVHRIRLNKICSSCQSPELIDLLTN